MAMSTIIQDTFTVGNSSVVIGSLLLGLGSFAPALCFLVVLQSAGLQKRVMKIKEMNWKEL